MVEHLTFNQVVEGSRPSWGTMKKLKLKLKGEVVKKLLDLRKVRGGVPVSTDVCVSTTITQERK